MEQFLTLLDTWGTGSYQQTFDGMFVKAFGVSLQRFSVYTPRDDVSPVQRLREA